LLAKKTRKIGIGMWNGWGGAIEGKETVRECAVRELFEESGMIAGCRDLKYHGKVVFHNKKHDGEDFDVEVHMFTLYKWAGTLKSNPEMKEPTFWPISNLPFDQMMPSDQSWVPLVVNGRFVDGEVWHGPDQKTLLRPSEIKEVSFCDIK